MKETNSINSSYMEQVKHLARENYIPIVQDDTLELLKTIVMILKPKRILELGSAVGYSAIYMCQALKSIGVNPQIVTVEIKEDMVKQARENIQQQGLSEFISVINCDAEEYMGKLITDNEYFNLVFIDAAKGQYVKYLEKAKSITKVGDCILADNVLFKGRVLGEYDEHKYRTIVNRLREYLKLVTTDEHLQTTVLNIGDGVAISIVKEKEKRI